MISLLPSFSETLVTTLPSGEVASRLQRATANTLVENTVLGSNKKLFYGYVHEPNFQLALRNTRLFSFTPLVFGHIEATSTGCIVFFNVQLFTATKVLFVFWSIVLAITAIVQVYLHRGAAGLVCLALLIFMHVIARLNFKQQWVPTRATLLNLLEG